MNNKLIVLGLINLICIPGCVHYTAVTPNQPIEIGKVYTVTTQKQWSMCEHDHVTSWTIDGPGLQKIQFFSEIKDGQSLFKAHNEQEMPQFLGTMSAIEVMDLVEASLSRQNLHNIKKESLKPCSFGKLDGFSFNFSFVTEGGLHYKGLAKGAIDQEKLYLVLYTGTGLHYFDKLSPEVEQIIADLEVI